MKKKQAVGAGVSESEEAGPSMLGTSAAAVGVALAGADREEPKWFNSENYHLPCRRPTPLENALPAALTAAAASQIMGSPVPVDAFYV